MKRSRFYVILALLTIILFAFGIYSFAISYKTRQYIIDSKQMYITDIAPSTTVSKFKNKLDKGEITIIDKNGKDISEESTKLITTGCKVKIKGKEYTTIVAGDVDSDGKYSYKDVLLLEDQIRGRTGSETTTLDNSEMDL